MAFVPPPLDRDFRTAQVRGRAERISASMRKPWVGAGLLTALAALIHRKRKT